MASGKLPRRGVRLRNSRRPGSRCAVESLERRRLLTTGYLALNLVSDQAATALVQDTNLVNPWGLGLNTNGGDLWIADNGSSAVSLYSGGVAGLPGRPTTPFGPDTPTISIPGGSATGAVFNGSTSFFVSSGNASGPASFLFGSLGGEITGYNHSVPTTPSSQAQLAVSTSGADYTGLAEAFSGTQNLLYAADFKDNRIDAFDGSFAPFATSGGFAATVPVGFAPYNIVNLNGQLYVAYAQQGPDGDAVAGQGFVDVFDYNGNFQKTLIPLGGALNAPWGIAQAPASFGDFSGDLLVANHGDGLIHAYNSQTGMLAGTLSAPSGAPLSIDGLRGLACGNGVSSGGAGELFFSAGADGGNHGLLGVIQSAQGVSLTAQGGVVTATANQSFHGTLAVFSDAQNLPPGSFTATINWGDGTTSTAGGVSALAGGGYAVSGSHTYGFSGTKSISIQIQDGLGNTARASSVVQVAAGGVSAAGLTFAPTEGAVFNGAVATFADGDGNTLTAAYQATIAWGDGATTAGTIAFSTGEFIVSGTHTYTDEATKSVTVTVIDVDGSLATATSTAKIADAALSSTAAAIAATLDALFNGTVAAFTDANPQSALTDYTATIDWGDGGTTSGTITAGSGGTFSVAGSHLYLLAGPQSIKVTVNDIGGSQAVVDETAIVSDIDVLAATLANIAPTQGTPFSGTIAAVADTDLATLADQLAATINWGDGNTTSGTVTGVAGVFSVAGDHTYLGEGYYPLSVTISHIGGTASASAVATITVADAGSLSITGLPIAATEGLTFSGEVATVTDSIAAPASVFTADIDWGDGTSSSGTVSGSAGQFTISGVHTYVEEGTYSPVVTIADLAPGTISATGTLSAIVGDAPLTATNTTFNSSEGQVFAGAVATVSDGNPLGAAADFTATIDWGDGTSTTGTISGSGGFTVAGTHAYAIGGTYTATITIDDAGGSTAVARSMAIVADYSLTATGVPLAGTEGQPFSGVVATFSDANPDGGNLADYSVTVLWGDGGTTNGTIAGSGGNYTVSGSYIFADVSDAVTVVINDVGGASATATDSASIADANTLTPSGTTAAATEGQTWSGTLATFADTYSGNPVRDFSAAVDWGDGQTTAAIVTGQSGAFTISGSHVYAEAGTYVASVVLRHNSPGTAEATAASTVTVADARLTAHGGTITATEGSTFSGVVATFGDANLLSAATDFTATIEWGDGTAESPGTVSLLAAGSFAISGQHVYADEDQNLPLTVVIADREGSQATAAGRANVIDAPITASAVSLTATEGIAFAGTVATFTDANPNAATTDFTATIDWGDGSSPATGTVSAAAGGGFYVTGLHTYADEAASLLVNVTINDRGGSSATVASTATVDDAPLTAGKITFTATEGNAFSRAVATFSDANGGAAATDFTATIDWGDGSPLTDGAISVAPGGGFLVTGTHVYAEKATRQAVVAIHDRGGSAASATSTASVIDAPLSPGAALMLRATAGIFFSGTLGTFTDADPAAPLSDFTATIDWGDGGAAGTGVVSSAPGAFIVSGSHVYANPAAAYTIKITVNDVDGANATVLASAHVASTHFTASGATITSIEGSSFSGIVATCDDLDPNPAHYAAMIAWGDGATTAGTIAPKLGGGFVVNGAHVFAAAGSVPMTVVVTNPSLDQLTVSGLANVADAPLIPSGITFTATEGMLFKGEVAAFTDTGGGNVADYTATIAWGDGSSSAGTVTTAGGGFAVSGSHTYAEETQGISVSVSISDVGGAKTTALSSAIVADAPLIPDPVTLNVPPGGTVDGLVLTSFTDRGGAGLTGDYGATIDWGDSTTVSGGTISASGSGFQVTGSHQYLLPGTYQIDVLLRDEGGSTATADVQAVVPPSANQLYVEAAYKDVLARVVDNPALIAWTALLDAGQPRGVLAKTLDHSAEYFADIIVTPAYSRYLGRAPDADGLAYWVDQLENHGLTDERLEAGFIGSPEFFAHAGGTNKAWIDTMYQDLLGRPADTGGENYWLGQLAAGISRAQVAYGFAAGPERESQRITDDYMHYLGRQPDQQGLGYWLAQFAAGLTNEDLISGFVASDEYFTKHSSG